MKRYISILFLLLSTLVMANPIIDWTCAEEVMVCSMDDNGDMSCCSADANHATSDMTCCPAMPRVMVTHHDLKVEVSQCVTIAKTKVAAIKTKWFNSNYVSDWKHIDLVSVTPTTPSIDGFKFKDIDRLNYICIYRI